jgi:hypothetical protein
MFIFKKGNVLSLLTEALGTEPVGTMAYLFEMLCIATSSMVPVIKSIKAIGVEGNTKFNTLFEAKRLVESYGEIQATNRNAELQAQIDNLSELLIQMREGRDQEHIAFLSMRDDKYQLEVMLKATNTRFEVLQEERNKLSRELLGLEQYLGITK